MAQVTLNWTPPGGANSLSQDVQYKLRTSSVWITNANVGPTITTATITGLVANTIYDFRIGDLCSYGGPSSSTSDSKIFFQCPVVTLTPTYAQISYSFNHVGASVNRYVIELLTANGSSVIATNDVPSPTSVVSGVFTGLAPNTEYKVRVTMYALTFTNVCTGQNLFTSVAPTCGFATGLSATITA